MKRKNFFCILLAIFFCLFSTSIFAQDISKVEIAGVNFPIIKTINGKELKLNGVAILKKFGFLQVYATGLYLEEQSDNPETIINSEQVKYMYTQYLTNKATKDKIQNGFLEVIKNCNPPDIFDENKNDINTFISWLDGDMLPGLTSETIYIPGEGLTLIYQNKIKGTILGNSFAKMYYNCNLGKHANEQIKQGLLNIKTDH